MLWNTEKFLTVIFAVLLLYIPVSAQEYVVDIKQFDVSDGLLHRNVQCVIEDDNGFIWLGLENGLQRFDGTEFKSWGPQNGFTEFTNIRNLQIDDEGWIWAWNTDKLEFVFIHTLTEEVRSLTKRFGNSFPDFRVANPMYKWFPDNILKNERDGNLILFNEAPYQIISYNSGQKFVIHPQLKLKDTTERPGLVKYDKGKFWFIFGGKKKRFCEMDIDGTVYKEAVIEGKGDFYVLAISDTEALFSRQYEGVLYKIRLDLETFRVSEQKVDFLPKILWANGYFWELKGSTWTVKKDNRELLSFDASRYQQSLQDFSGTYEDHWGRLWLFGQYGLTRMNIHQTPFKKYFYQPPEITRTYNNAIRNIIVHNDTLYAAVEYHGIAKVPLYAPGKMEVLDGDFHSRNYFYGARGLAVDKKGILLTAHSGYLKWIDGKNIRKERIEAKNETGVITGSLNKLSDVWSIYPENEDIWIGTSQGLWKRCKNGKYIYYEMEGGYNPVYFIKRTGGSLWIGADGLYRIPKGTDKIIKQTISKETSLSVYCMYTCSDGNSYFGTNKGIIMKNQKGVYSVFKDKKNGLSGNEVYGIYADNNGNFWMSTNDGINCLRLSSGEFTVFREKDGITHNEFNRVSHYKDDKGNIYFGSLNGITAINPKLSLMPEKNGLSLQITSFEKFSGKNNISEDFVAQVRQKEQIKYYPRDRFIRIRFAIPGTDNPNALQYAWKINDLHDSWNYQKENVLQLVSLPYGKHTLQIKGQTDTGKWTQSVEIEIKVIKPFLLRTWFLLLCTGLVLFAVILIIRTRTLWLKERQKELQREIETATIKITNDKETIEKQAEELRKLDQVKTRFFTNITHELRTPLSLIKGPLSSVMKSKQLSEKNLSFVKTAENNVEILQKLISSLLDLSKLESESMKINNVSFPLFEFTRLMVSNFESYAQHVGIEFIFDYRADKTLHIKLDKEKLETILNNLISNAIKFTPEGGTITVSVYDMGNEVVISVQDTGIGISQEDVPRIFERFYQASNTDRTQTGGTGIGLTISIELARLMGGDISVISSPEDGSRFTVSLPRNEVLGSFEIPNQKPHFAIKQPDAIFDHRKGAKILVVEDNKSFSNYITTILSEHYQTTCAFNGKKAIEILENLEKPYLPNMIVSDIMMPEMDGYQLLEYLKSHNIYWEIPVIMLTARVALQDKLKALRIGVDDYITKPFEEEELLVRMANLLKHADNRMEEQEKESHKLNMADQNWLIDLEKYVRENYSDENFGMNEIGNHFAMSISTLHRKIKLLTGLTPAEYLREYRLNAGKELLERGEKHTVAEIAFAVGFGNAKSFSRSFKVRFGKLPSAYF